MFEVLGPKNFSELACILKLGMVEEAVLEWVLKFNDLNVTEAMDESYTNDCNSFSSD